MISIFQDRTRDYVLPPIRGDKGQAVTPVDGDDYRWRIHRGTELVLEVTTTANGNGSVIAVVNDRLVLTLDEADASLLHSGVYDGELIIVASGKTRYRHSYAVVLHETTSA